MKVDIGIDPDSYGSGVAVYINNQLKSLLNLNITEIYLLLSDKVKVKGITLKVHIENVEGNRCSSFNHVKGPNSKKINAKISESVGRCKQVQREIEFICEMLEVEIVKYKVSSNWKKGKLATESFKRMTGWTGRSNEDTRSAAYFGFLGCK